MLTDEELADPVQDVGVNWEHVVASNGNARIPEHPLKITDVLVQENIDPLDMITETFVREVNPRSIDEKTGGQNRENKQRLDKGSKKSGRVTLQSVQRHTYHPILLCLGSLDGKS